MSKSPPSWWLCQSNPHWKIKTRQQEKLQQQQQQPTNQPASLHLPTVHKLGSLHIYKVRKLETLCHLAILKTSQLQRAEIKFLPLCYSLWFSFSCRKRTYLRLLPSHVASWVFLFVATPLTQVFQLWKLLTVLTNSSYCVIVRVRVVPKRTVVGNWCFDNLSGSHLQSQVNSICQSMML